MFTEPEALTLCNFAFFFARFTAVLSVQYYHLNMLNVLWTEHRKEDDFCSKIVVLCFQLGLSDQPQNVKKTLRMIC